VITKSVPNPRFEKEDHWYNCANRRVAPVTTFPHAPSRPSSLASIPWSPRRLSLRVCPFLSRSKLKDLGLEPHLMSEETMDGMLAAAIARRDSVNHELIAPAVKWDKSGAKDATMEAAGLSR